MDRRKIHSLMDDLCKELNAHFNTDTFRLKQFGTDKIDSRSSFDWTRHLGDPLTYSKELFDLCFPNGSKIAFDPDLPFDEERYLKGFMSPPEQVEEPDKKPSRGVFINKLIGMIEEIDEEDRSVFSSGKREAFQDCINMIRDHAVDDLPQDMIQSLHEWRVTVSKKTYRKVMDALLAVKNGKAKEKVFDPSQTFDHEAFPVGATVNVGGNVYKFVKEEPEQPIADLIDAVNVISTQACHVQSPSSGSKSVVISHGNYLKIMDALSAVKDGKPKVPRTNDTDDIYEMQTYEAYGIKVCDQNSQQLIVGLVKAAESLIGLMGDTIIASEYEALKSALSALKGKS